MVAGSTTPVCITPSLRSRSAASSSPDLPSLSQILPKRNDVLTSKGQTSPLPDSINFGFTSALDLLKTSQSSDQSTVISIKGDVNHTDRLALTENESVQSKSSKARGDDRQKLKRSSKPRAQSTKALARAIPKADVTNNLNKHSIKEIKDLATGKIRENRCDREDQSKIKKSKITKPGASNRSSKPSNHLAKEKKATSENGSQAAKLKADGHATITSIESGDGWGLEEALKRRKDWTPVKDTAQKALELQDIETAWSSLIPKKGSPNVEASNVLSSNLLDSFGYPTSDQSTITKPKATRTPSGEALIKRRKIDFVQGIAVPPTTSILAETKKSPKKKPRTITSKAIASFVSEEGPNVSTLLDYFAPPADNLINHRNHSKPPKQDLGSSETNVTEPPVKRSKKGKVAKIKTKKQAILSVSLLSPSSALKDVNNQDILFGTSSQLVQEESPTLIKDLQKAVSVSELPESPVCEQHLNDSQTSVFSYRSSLSNAESLVLSRNLWTVAARDLEGSLLNAEVVNLADASPHFQQYVSTVNSSKSFVSEQSTFLSIPPATDSDFKPIDVVSAAEAPNAQQVSKASESIELETEKSMPRSVAEASLRERPKSKSPVKKRKPSVASKALATQSTSLEMPNYKGYTVNDLSKAVVAWGFKPIKSRKAKITLLEQCWEENRDLEISRSLLPNLQESSMPVKDSNIKISKPANSTKKQWKPPNAKSLEVMAETRTENSENISSPKKRRGRPRKSQAPDTTGAQSKFWKTAKPASDKRKLPALVEDISDALAIPSTPSPPCRGSSFEPSAPLSLPNDLPRRDTDTETNTLRSKITEAVRRCPPTHDIQNLTFHERMLMYEPIVLEDLTVWLNEGALDKVGWDDEVDPLLVKQWCESQSICCVWRENLRGGERARW